MFRKVFLLIFLMTVVFSVQADETSPLEIPGRIAYIGLDNNVYTISLHQQSTVQLTDDASRTRHYQWPTWSENSKLAYFCCDTVFSNTFGVEVYVSLDGTEAGDVVYENDNQAFTYANWSSNLCSEGAECGDLGVLMSQLEGPFSVELIRTSRAGSASITAGNGAPFYFSWSPDGQQMLWQRDNRRLELYDVQTAEVNKLRAFPGIFQAPQWSPVDDRLLFGEINADDETLTDLVIVANDESLVLQEGLRGLVTFNWSPDGNYVAYRTVESDYISPIYVVDSVTGELVMGSNNSDIIAFFWSPDSSKIAFASLAAPRGSFNATNPDAQMIGFQPVQDNEGLAWSVIDLEAEEVRLYGTFIPTTEMIYMFNFFDQFAQSHQIWSPDSTHIVFSALSADSAPAINILDMTRADSVPFFITEGLIGIWSYH